MDDLLGEVQYTSLLEAHTYRNTRSSYRPHDTQMQHKQLLCALSTYLEHGGSLDGIISGQCTSFLIIDSLIRPGPGYCLVLSLAGFSSMGRDSG